jgi:CcmD family protein
MNTFEMNEAFIIAAYSVTWLVLLGYLTRLTRKSARVRADYDSMTGGKAEGGGGR